MLNEKTGNHVRLRLSRTNRLAIGRRYAAARKGMLHIFDLTADSSYRDRLNHDLAVLDAIKRDERGSVSPSDRVKGSTQFVTGGKAAAPATCFSRAHHPTRTADPVQADPKIRVCILSFLFNWPTRGGGNVHTVELVKFLARAGYTVKHFFASYLPWKIGEVRDTLPYSERIQFDESEWNITDIQRQYRKAVAEFDPDVVIITDAWNIKPILADAIRRYPYILRQQALECICPLNNLRLLVDSSKPTQCHLNQLAAPSSCHRCLNSRGSQSGPLHREERALSGVGTPWYDRTLKRAYRDAQVVLALNPEAASLLEPHSQSVLTVTWGMDPGRFPWPPQTDRDRITPPMSTSDPSGAKRLIRLFMGGVVNELMKGFHVLHSACTHLWRERQDFELFATGEPAGRFDEFTTFTGWLDQDELPQHLGSADVIIMPTIAQEGLGRITVEAMGVGRAVIASRIGGLPFTVSDGVTGLLVEPGNVDDLVEKIRVLLDSAELREQYGNAGRKRFDKDFTWPTVIERHYRPILVGRKQCDFRTVERAS